MYSVYFSFSTFHSVHGPDGVYGIGEDREVQLKHWTATPRNIGSFPCEEYSAAGWRVGVKLFTFKSKQVQVLVARALNI
ncbi:hypothetical protein F0562_031093 [Nyssa sinensis]|uniref:Uncharacterized protein n=1 Tax=Nyssa sinensis TaxID=561372 RepID=A0A5J5AQZ8_9ASTE|nr:hypothetical protein F0562_031093 [Nyssa sinensis]